MWIKKKKITRVDRRNGEKGSILPMVLILLVLGSLTLTPLMSYMSSGVKTGQMYEKKTDALYAADAGAEDAIWQIKGDHLQSTVTGYDPYDYVTTWTYQLSEQVNGIDVENKVANVWIPKNVSGLSCQNTEGLSVPCESDANAIISDAKLIVTGRDTGSSTYEIKISYNKDPADNPLLVDKIGVWLPAGFGYVAGSSNLESYYVSVSTPDHAGGKAVIWNLSSYPFAGSSPWLNPLPSVNPANNPMTAIITFSYTPPPDKPNAKPDAVAWVETSSVPDIPFSWDADTKVYKIVSDAGDTKVEVYTTKSELRKMSSAIKGDYTATGTSLMIPTFGNENHRDLLLTESSRDISTTELDGATVEMAYLYWSGWVQDKANGIWWDYCGNLTSADPNECKFNRSSNKWTVVTGGGTGNTYYERFRGEDSGSSLTMKSDVDLSGVSSATIQWDQSAVAGSTTDKLYFKISKDGGLNWSSAYLALQGNTSLSTYSFSIPNSPINYYTSQFQIKFYLSSFDGSGECAYIDNILITDNSITTHEDRNITFTIATNEGPFDTYTTALTADPSDPTDRVWSDIVISGSETDGYYYACRKDVTALVKEHSNGADLSDPSNPLYGNGKGIYTVGNIYASNMTAKPSKAGTWYMGDSSYAGWSLVIVYSSPVTTGHQLYLWEDMTSVPYQDENGDPYVTTKSMSGFIVPAPIVGIPDAAKLTVFVGEGDLRNTGDYIAFVDQRSTNEHTLWDGVDCTTSNTETDPTNVWNGYSGDSDVHVSSSTLSAESGIDVDTFHIKWADNWLQQGDTSAQIKLSTGASDGYVLVYLIASFCSETTTGNALQYLIRQ